MIIYPSGTLIVPKVDGSDNYKETILNSSELPITTTGSSYENLNISGSNVQSAFDDLVENIDTVIGIPADTKEPTGFVNRTSSTIDFDSSTRTFSITPTVDTFEVYIHGNKYDKVASSGTLPNVTDNYFIYYDENSNFTISTSAWDLFDNVPIALVYWSSTVSSGILLEERHGIIMDAATHYHLHNSKGTFVINGFGIADYTESPTTPTIATNTFSISNGTIADEDINHAISDLADGGPYSLLSRSGVSGEWIFEDSSSLPYYIGANYIQYNQLNGSNWELTEASPSNSLNYYVFATNAVDEQYKYIVIPGQSIYTAEEDAITETVYNLSLGTMPFTEFAPLYQITFTTGGAWSSAIGKCRITNVKRIIGANLSVTSSVAAADHSSLSGRSTPNSHPASAISTTVSGAVLYSKDNYIQEDPKIIWDQDSSTLLITGDIGTFALPVSEIHVNSLNSKVDTTISGSLKFHSSSVPTTVTGTGDNGEIRYDGDFVYFKVDGLWRRTSISLF